MEFTVPQQEAINHLNGPCLVLAGPGSGKTAVLTRRIRKLVSSNVSPDSILVITFTKASALEMKERFNSLMDGNDCPVTFGTFHSCFYSILRQEMNLNNESIIMGAKRIELLREVADRVGLPADGEEYYENMSKEFSYVTNMGIAPETYHSLSFSQLDFKTAYIEYAKLKERYGLIDFDDMLLKTYRLFNSRKDVLSKWQNRFRYILVDEAQDMNDLQYSIVKLLSSKDKNVFIVGDDDQSIYGFRGANPSIMKRFYDEFANCKRIVLDSNFRCPANIVALSKNLICNNQERFPKEIKPCNKDGVIKIIDSVDKVDESKRVAKLILKLSKDGIEYRDIAIIFRNNIQGHGMLNELINNQIPFFIKDNMQNVYNHFIFQDLESYFRVALGEGNRQLLLRIINRPVRFIQRAALDRAEASLEDCKKYYHDTPFMQQRIDALMCDLKLISKMSPFSAANYIKKGMGYEQFVKEEAIKQGQSLDDINDIFDLFDSVVRETKSLAKAVELIGQLRAKMELLNSTKKQVKGNQVGLYTLHGSKGLEFRVCIIIDINEGIIPSKKAKSIKEIEEERRMFYVGITRAKEQLYLFYSTKKNQEALMPSRFLTELQYENYSSSSSPYASS